MSILEVEAPIDQGPDASMESAFWWTLAMAILISITMTELCIYFPVITPIFCGITFFGVVLSLVLHSFEGRSLRNIRSQLGSLQQVFEKAFGLDQ